MSERFAAMICVVCVMAAQPAAAQTPPVAAQPEPQAKLADCTASVFPGKLSKVRPQHKRSVVVMQSEPAHAMNDVIAVVGEPVVVEAKLAYGAHSKDLEDERVDLWMSVCERGLEAVSGGVTDDDGRVRFTIGADRLKAPGLHTLRVRVAADGSFAEARIWVLPKGAPVVVFDIDGTLTTKDGELFKDLGADLFDPLRRGDYVPQARAASAEVTRYWHERNYPIIYLTGRPYWLEGRSRQWLKDNGFAPGALWLAGSTKEIAPHEASVGKYKLARLGSLVRMGIVLHTAYGNATTDIYAYKGAGIDVARTFIAGPHGGEGGTQALGADYVKHLEGLKR